MTRQDFWANEFSKTATEISEYLIQTEEDETTAEELAIDAADWADLALAEYDKRFPIKPNSTISQEQRAAFSKGIEMSICGCVPDQQLGHSEFCLLSPNLK